MKKLITTIILLVVVCMWLSFENWKLKKRVYVQNQVIAATVQLRDKWDETKAAAELSKEKARLIKEKAIELFQRNKAVEN